MRYYAKPTSAGVPCDVVIRNETNTDWIQIEDVMCWTGTAWEPIYQRAGAFARGSVTGHYVYVDFGGALSLSSGSVPTGFTVGKEFPVVEPVNILTTAIDGPYVVLSLDSNWDSDTLMFVHYDPNVGNLLVDGQPIAAHKRRVTMNLILLDGSRTLDGTWTLGEGEV